MQAFQCVYVLFLLLLLQIICQIGCWEIANEWSFFKKPKYNIYIFNALIRNNEQFDQNLHYITFFNIFFEEIE